MPTYGPGDVADFSGCLLTPHTATFTASGTFHTPASLTGTSFIEGYGRGGNGGTYPGSGAIGAGGGGGGGYSNKTMTLTPSTDYAVVFDAGSGDVTFVDGSTLVAPGGFHASGQTAGAGGSGGVGDVTTDGESGSPCLHDNESGDGGSAGGPGGGPGGTAAAGSGSGDPGDDPGGGGGGGGDAPGTGGAGGGGILTIAYSTCC